MALHVASTDVDASAPAVMHHIPCAGLGLDAAGCRAGSAACGAPRRTAATASRALQPVACNLQRGWRTHAWQQPTAAESGAATCSPRAATAAAARPSLRLALSQRPARPRSSKAAAAAAPIRFSQRLRQQPGSLQRRLPGCLQRTPPGAWAGDGVSLCARGPDSVGEVRSLLMRCLQALHARAACKPEPCVRVPPAGVCME
jgi:hypothetical protein